MSEKKKFSYTSDEGSAEKKTPQRHRQDFGDIARQTGADRIPEPPQKPVQEVKASAPAAASDPFKSDPRIETVKRLREERMQRSGAAQPAAAKTAAAQAGEVKTSPIKTAPAAAFESAQTEGVSAQTRKQAAALDKSAAQQAAHKAPPTDSARAAEAAQKKVFKSADAQSESGVSDSQLELVKKMKQQKTESSAASEWKGQPAAAASARVSDAAARASFSSLAPSEDDFTRTVSRALDEASDEFEAVDEDFAAPAKSAKTKKTAAKSPKTAAKDKKSAKKTTKRSARVSDDDGDAPRERAPKKKGKALAIILCALGAIVLLAGGTAALYFTGVIDLFPVSANSYQAADDETFMKYLTHPSLRAGDSISASGAVVDVDAQFGGFISLPLVNMSGVSFENGVVLFLGGASQDNASLDGVTFNNCEVYIDAPNANVAWSGAASDKYINCATLNGSPHLTDESFPMVGAKMNISVNLVNSGGALTNAEVTFSSPSYIFTEGETYLVDSIPANSTVAVEVPVIATEGGRTRIYAHDASGAVSGDSGYIDIIGTGYVSGDIHTHTQAGIYKRYSTLNENVEYGYRNGMSFIVSVENFFSQDEENQANEAIWAEEAARRKKEEEAATKLEEERKAAEEAAAAEAGEAAPEGGGEAPAAEGASTDTRRLPVLTASAPITAVPLTSETTASDDGEEEEEDTIGTEGLDPENPEKLAQSTVDAIVGGTGRFLQLVGNETGQNNQHMLILKSNFVPRSDYGRQILEYGLWTYQAAVDSVVSKGGIIILPHFFDRDIAEGASMIKSLYDVTALEIMSGGRGSDSLETRAEFQAWDAINAYGMQRLFAVMSSNNFTKEEVGTRYLSGEMGRLTESNIYNMIESGNYIATNGPTVRFELGGAEMGGMLFVSAEGDAGAQPEPAEGDAEAVAESTVAEEQAGEVSAATTRTQAKLYACDDSPLTNVKLIRHDIKTVIENPTPDYVLDIDLTGQGVYVYSEVVDLDIKPGEFYRLEVRSETDNAGDDIGVGLANPIWVFDSGDTPSGAVSAAGFEYKFGGEIVKSANNNWCIKTKNFVPALFSADTTAAYTDVAVHKRGSDNFPDTVTVYMLAPDGKTSSAETLYILN